MSYWWLLVCIIMGIFSAYLAKWAFLFFFCKTVPEPEFMGVDQAPSKRIDEMGHIIDVKI